MIKTIYIDGKNEYKMENGKIRYTYFFTCDYYDIKTRKTTIQRRLLKTFEEYKIGDKINVKWNKDKYKWEIVENEPKEMTPEELEKLEELPFH